MFLMHNKKENIIPYISNFYSYKYGLNYTFSYININYMKIFYLYFPVYNKELEKLSWDHYLELIKISNSNERNFYYKTSVFCNLSSSDMSYLINNNFYSFV